MSPREGGGDGMERKTTDLPVQAMKSGCSETLASFLGRPEGQESDVLQTRRAVASALERQSFGGAGYPESESAPTPAVSSTAKPRASSEQPQPTDFASLESMERSASEKEAMKRLADAVKLMAKLQYSAKNTDAAMDAFEGFRMAVLRVVSSKGKEDDVALAQLEPKQQILEFMVDFHTRKPIWRSKVTSTLLRLLEFEDWAAAIESDPSVDAVVRELTDDPSAPKRMTRVANGIAVNLTSAASAAVDHGGVGAVYARVLAGYDLEKTKGRYPDPYVRASLGDKFKRTELVAESVNPRWESAPFVFEVRDKASAIKFDVLDNHVFKDVLLGSVSLKVTSISTTPGVVRHKLSDAKQGELELELIYLSGEHLDDVQPKKLPSQPDEPPEPPPSTWLMPQVGMASQSFVGAGKAASPKKNGILQCPAGHDIDKKKEGLRWFQIGPQKYCDVCSKLIPRDDTRWRCQFHCDYDVCQKCFKKAARPSHA
eukprot:TRINITY_DN36589_c0_g1_i2.p1 TRINITY_DN36589_c0_g1~~TRINITY_DN36589_c0_g1_i2.p1  ORF type:complete len:485 (-),score=135.94 TRINITY_DN36589_c0_g1_i2:87-1541(-)